MHVPLQAEDGPPTVQACMERALCTLLRVPRERLGVGAAGRTDAGVHARGQVRCWPAAHVHMRVYTSVQARALMPACRRALQAMAAPACTH